MVRKKVAILKRKNVSLRSKKIISPWFRKRDPSSKDSWGFVPVNLKGCIAFVLLIGLNIFAANYFNLDVFVLDNYFKMGVVFFLSLFVFIEIAKRKTRGIGKKGKGKRGKMGKGKKYD